MTMNEKILLDQVFYGSGTLGYGILATSIADTKLANTVLNACLEVGQIPGSGLRAPVFLSRIIGACIVMARLCNGARDPSGRSTLFVHALVGSAQEVRNAGITTFTLADTGVFRDSVTDFSAKTIEVEANRSSTHPSSVALELPAAIETSEPDEKLMRQIVAGRETEMSWSTFAFEDMFGYDIICISKNAPRPSARAIYDSDLRLLRSKPNNRDVRIKSTPASTVEDTPLSSAPSCDVSSHDRAEWKNRMFVALLVSLALNLVLIIVVCRTMAEGSGESYRDKVSDVSLLEEARAIFAGNRLVTDAMLERSGYPLQCLFLRKGDVADEKPGQVELFHKLLAYRDFVEEKVIKRKKEK